MKPTNHEPTTGDIAPVQSPEVLQTWTDYANAICVHWHKGVDSILQTARYCSQADERLSRVDYEALKSKLPFDNTVLCKLSKIGSDERLFQPRVRALLPPNYSTIYEVHLLSDEVLEGAVESGALYPEARRQDVQALREKRPYKPRAQLPVEVDDPKVRGRAALQAMVQKSNAIVSETYGGAAKKRVVGEVTVPADYPEPRLTELTEELKRIVITFDAEFVRRQTPDERAVDKYERELTSYFERCLAEGRTLARQRIQRLKKTRLSSGGKKWGFAPDETSIERLATWEDIKKVFGFIGIEDEFDDLKRRTEHPDAMPDAPTIPDSTAGGDPIEAMKEQREVVTLRQTDKSISEMFADLK